MNTKMKLLVFSNRSLTYREVRLFQWKVVGIGVLLGALTFFGIFLLNHLSGDFLGFGYQRASDLSVENGILKQQLTDLSRRSSAVQRSLEALASRGNELRLMVDLPRIDGDGSTSPIGGSVQPSDLAILSRETGALVSDSRKLIDRLEREVRLQEASYLDVYKKLQHNKVLFAHIPAIKPMEGYLVPKSFGMRVHPVLGVYRMHEGIDILNDVGTKIYATGDGTVKFAGRTEGGYGSVVEIDHGYGYVTLYAHLSNLLVRSGQSVKRGEVIAKCGRTGLVSGPHLHYEVRYNGSMMNPTDYFFNDIEASQYRSLLAKVK